MFESLQQLHPQSAPVGQGLGSIASMIVQARARKQQDDQVRARLLLDQQNIQSDNARADAELNLRREESKRTTDNQAEERRRKSIEDFNTIWEMAGKDPAHAMALAKAHGFKIDTTDFRNPVAVPVDGAASLPVARGEGGQEDIRLLPLHDAADAPARAPSAPPQLAPDQRDPALDIHLGEGSNGIDARGQPAAAEVAPAGPPAPVPIEAPPAPAAPDTTDYEARPAGLAPGAIDVMGAVNALAEAHKRHGKKKMVFNIGDVPITVGAHEAPPAGAPIEPPPFVPGQAAPPPPAPPAPPAPAPPVAAPPPPPVPPPPAPAPAPPPAQPMAMGLDQAAPGGNIQPVSMPSIGNMLQRASLPHRFRISGGVANLPDVEIDPDASRATQDAEDAKQIRLRQAAPEVRAQVQRALAEQRQADFLAKQEHDDQERARYKLTAGQQDQNFDERTAALRQHNNAVVVQGLDADTNRTINAFQGVIKEVKQASLAKQDVFTAKALSKINEELAGDGASQALAIDTLGQIGQGGKATNTVIGLLKAPTGMLGSVADKAYMATHDGRHSPAVIAAYKNAAEGIHRSVAETAGQNYLAMYRKIGPGSLYYNPSTQALADTELDAFGVELGLDPGHIAALEDQASRAPHRTRGPAEFAPGLAPGRAAAPKHAGRAAPAAPAAPAPGAHPTEQPVGTIRDLKDGRRARKVGPNDWQVIQ